jgi:hypothetical protein
MIFADGTLLGLLDKVSFRAGNSRFNLVKFDLKKGKFNLLFWTINLDDKLTMISFVYVEYCYCFLLYIYVYINL